ncbi:MAG TPA: FAD-dependent oxidoreductase [Candidatus Sulfomarinibacteraceae bacterium]|nr:FAD-dependent oxidoreductase [Candidatus Sulfomarinibacteraceae bacterium]
MSTVPQQASVVVIGAGIVGNSVVYHLALQGWKDIVLLDKGPLPNPGGSTGHASNFIYPIDHSKEMTLLTRDSVKQYKELGVFTESGGLELARTEERMEELRRRMASAHAWGEPGELITPAEVKEMVPFVNTDIILGAFWSPTVGVVDSLRAGTLMREKAQELDAISIHPNTEVTDVEMENGRIRAVHTDRGVIKTDTIVIACGVWSPRIAQMAGARIPLVPAVHQMISVGPVPMFEDLPGEISYPIVRDMDTFMYERQNGNDMEVGSYAHRPILHEPDEIPSIEEAKLSPTELPFTADDFDPQMEQALELMPELLGDERVGIRHAINGLLSLTPDGFPLLGEIPGFPGLWSAAAVWIKEGPGVGRLIAEWMTEGVTEIDPHSSDIARFYEYAQTQQHVNARTSENFNKTYGIVHPMEQWESNRNVRLSPFYQREKELGAVFFETAGWERPQWYESNSDLLEEYGDRVNKRPHEWDARWWSPIINAEHLALRDRAGLVDLTAFAVFDVSGPGALDYIQKMAVAQMDVPVGRGVYTPLITPAGGLKADLTITRIAPDAFRIVTGGGLGEVDKKWFVDHLPEDGSAQLHDQTSALCTAGLWGPRARGILQSVTEEDVSNEAFPFATAQEITIGTVQAWALRISYVGELGWEIYAPMDQGQKLWDTLWEAGQPHGMVPVGIGVYGTTARLEKGYRLYGHELEQEYNVFEAGLNRPKVKRADFIGREAYMKQREEDPAAILCTITVDDHTSKSGIKRYMLGHEPILSPDGEPLVDSKGRRSYVTSAGNGPSVGKYILMGYLPPEYAKEGQKVCVEYMNELYPATVAVAGSRPLFDPDNERVKI